MIGYCGSYITKYITQYDFYDDIDFLESVMISVRYQRGVRNDSFYDDLISKIFSNKQSLELYDDIVNRSFSSFDEINYDEFMQKVLKLRDIIEK